MKNILTLFFILVSIGAYSQSGVLQQPLKHKMPANAPIKANFEISKKYPVGLPKKARSSSHDASRSQYNSWFYIDYGTLDTFYTVYGPNPGGSWYRDDTYSFGVINSSLPVDSTYYQQWAFTWFPQIIDFVNNPFWPFNNYNPDSIQMTIDTVYVTCGHVNTSNTNDTITVSIWDYDAFYGSDSFYFYPAEGLNGILYGQKQVIMNASIFGGTGVGDQPGTFLLGTYPFSFANNPVVIPTGKRFIIQIKFNGPSQDKFYLGSARRNDCRSQCGASVPYVFDSYPILHGTSVGLDSFNSQYGFRYEDALGDTGVYPSTYFYQNCNGDNVENDCELIYAQDFDIFPNIEAVLNQFYIIAADSPATACLQSTVTLLAEAGGSTATPYTYTWTTTGGNLLSATGTRVELETGNNTTNDTVVVTATDANNQTIMDTLIIPSNAIDLAITNPTPITINCNSSALITTSVSGNTSGINYFWSNGVTGADSTTQTISTAGNIGVTVTNSSGCADSVQATVSYSGASNKVSFELPETIGIVQWAGCSLTFTNTSTAYMPPWTGIFTGGDEDTVNGAVAQIYYTYQQAGAYNATLTLDSGGCVFFSTRTVIISNKPDSVNCDGITINVQDLTFSDNITLMPNPANGYVHLNINGVQNNVSVKVYNILGEEALSYQANGLSSGVYSKDFDLTALSSGTYLIRIDSGDQTAIKKLVISR